MVKNFDVVDEFVNVIKPLKTTTKTRHLFYEENILYSYGIHFPLCIKLLDGYIVNSNGYSNTTARHKGLLIRAITNEGNFTELNKNKKDYPNIVLMTTDEIKRLIDDIKWENRRKVETIKELKNIMMLGELENE